MKLVFGVEDLDEKYLGKPAKAVTVNMLNERAKRALQLFHSEFGQDASFVGNNIKCTIRTSDLGVGRKYFSDNNKNKESIS